MAPPGVALAILCRGHEVLHIYDRELANRVVDGMASPLAADSENLNELTKFAKDFREVRNLLRARGARSHAVAEGRCDRVLDSIKREFALSMSTSSCAPSRPITSTTVLFVLFEATLFLIYVIEAFIGSAPGLLHWRRPGHRLHTD